MFVVQWKDTVNLLAGKWHRNIGAVFCNLGLSLYKETIKTFLSVICFDIK